MGKLIDIPCDEILSELIIEEGEVVYGLLTANCQLGALRFMSTLGFAP